MARKQTAKLTKKPGHSAGRGKEQDRFLVLEKLKVYFQAGLTINRACAAYNSNDWEDSEAGGFKEHSKEKKKRAPIARTTIQTWYENDEEVRQLIDSWRDIPNVLARRSWIRKIIAGDYQASKDWLERQEKAEFSTRKELTGRNGESLVDALSVEDQKMIDEVFDVNYQGD